MTARKAAVATLDRVPRQYESIQDAASRAGVSVKTIRRRIDDGVLAGLSAGADHSARPGAGGPGVHAGPVVAGPVVIGDGQAS